MEKRFLSINKFCKKYGVPVQLVRKEVSQGLVPGFYSGTWFYVDSFEYSAELSERTSKQTAKNISKEENKNGN